MRRAVLGIGVAVVLMLAPARTASAQPSEGFGVGYFDIGPVIGLGGIGDASVSIGGRAEYGFKALPDLGNGVLSIAGAIDHYSYGLASFGDFTYTPIGVTVNYHFRLDNQKLDPFFGVGLGDYIVTTPVSCSACSFNSGVYAIGRVGIRYFFAPNFAAYADAGSGAGSLHVGVMIKLKGAE